MKHKRKAFIACVTAAAATATLTMTAEATQVRGEPGKGAAGCAYPGEALDLTNWKINLPTGDPGIPREIKQPELDTYAIAPWFHLDSCKGGVQFRAAVNGNTTPNSSYARAELREMTNDGKDHAAWDASTGTHTLIVEEAFTALPAVKPHVVGAQIHSGSDDITVFRLEGSNLYVTNDNDTHYHLITDDYKLGTKFEAKFVVEDGLISAYYNGEFQTSIAYDGPINFFKAGAYTQANCKNSFPCSEGNYGEVHIYDLQVSHS